MRSLSIKRLVCKNVLWVTLLTTRKPALKMNQICMWN